MTRVLIIEDDRYLGDVLTQKLLREGYEVVLASDGGDGFQKISEIRPDLLLLDIILPTMNGYEILEAKKKDPTIEKIPTIVISNSGQPVEISRALALGVCDYLVKAQMDPHEIMAKVHHCLGSSEPEVDLSGTTVLLVEDDPFLSDLLTTKLKRSGASVALAHDGEAAVSQSAAVHPNVILLDIVLPGISGIEVLERIKKDPATAQIPVIMLSNLGQESDIEKTKHFGAVRHLIKAEHDPEEILREIVAVLKEQAGA